MSVWASCPLWSGRSEQQCLCLCFQLGEGGVSSTVRQDMTKCLLPIRTDADFSVTCVLVLGDWSTVPFPGHFNDVGKSGSCLLFLSSSPICYADGFCLLLSWRSHILALEVCLHAHISLSVDSIGATLSLLFPSPPWSFPPDPFRVEPHSANVEPRRWHSILPFKFKLGTCSGRANWALDLLLLYWKRSLRILTSLTYWILQRICHFSSCHLNSSLGLT